jgi:hypothetical protein
VRWWAIALALAGCLDIPPPAQRTIAYVGPFAGRDVQAASTDSFPIAASSAGDAVVLMVGCSGLAPPTISVGAPGWTFEQFGVVAGSPSSRHYASVFGAIAPDTSKVMMTIDIANGCGESLIALGDEFANTDPTGGPTTFEQVAQTSGSTNTCVTMLTASSARDAIWAACYGSGAVTGPGHGYTLSATNGLGDSAEYKLTTDPTGTVQGVDFVTTSLEFVVIAVAIKP